MDWIDWIDSCGMPLHVFSMFFLLGTAKKGVIFFGKCGFEMVKRFFGGLKFWAIINASKKHLGADKGWVFPYISRIHTAQKRGGFLHFRYLKCLVFFVVTPLRLELYGIVAICFRIFSIFVDTPKTNHST